MTVATLQRFGVQLRAEVQAEGRMLVGRAAVFDQIANVGSHYERIERRAFDRVLADKATDVRALFNHNPNMLLGRQSAGTLRLRASDDGLDFELDLPDTSYANDLRALVERGDVTGASFGFIPGDDVWLRAQDGRRVRSHTQIEALRDVSPAPFPVYDGTDGSVHLRSADSFDDLDLGDFEIVELDDDLEVEEVDEPTDDNPEPSHRSNNHSALIRARARIHLPTKEQQ